VAATKNGKDGILIGASSVDKLEQSLMATSIDTMPLPDEVVEAFDV
jgi:aryl-alcohol dehydrogenase-like predicted oxidoreductase